MLYLIKQKTDMTIKMRESLVLKKLRAGESVCSFKVNLADARVVEIAGQAGFDCLWLDQEHIGQDWSILASQSGRPNPKVRTPW